jgi:hypothetical protein
MVVVMRGLRFFGQGDGSYAVVERESTPLFHFSQVELAAGLGGIKKQLCHFGIPKDKPCQNVIGLVLYKHTVFPRVTALPDL